MEIITHVPQVPIEKSLETNLPTVLNETNARVCTITGDEAAANELSEIDYINDIIGLFEILRNLSTSEKQYLEQNSQIQTFMLEGHTNLIGMEIEGKKIIIDIETKALNEEDENFQLIEISELTKFKKITSIIRNALSEVEYRDF